MNLPNTALLDRYLSAAQRETLEKYLPLILIVALVWLATRGLRRMFWTTFALFWVFHGMHGMHILPF